VSIDLAVLRIERGWSKYPGWFDEQARDVQLRLLAMDRVDATTGRSGG
jgi:hypothetical protein